MKNHGEKTKDMIESVLPSTARKRAREQRRLIHNRARARQRAALAAVRATYDMRALTSATDAAGPN